MENKDYTSEILGIIRSNASPGVMRNQLEDYHENDLAEVFPDLTIVERRKICRILDTEMLSDIFEHIDEKPAAEYLDEMDVRKAAKILSSMETDAVIDVLKMIPKEKRALLIELTDADTREDIAVIASFDDEEIGSRMTTNFIMIRENLTVKQAMSSLVEQAAKNDNISTIFMVTEDQTFYGAMDLKDLIIARQDSPLEDLVVTSYPYVYGHELIDDCIEKLKDYSEDSIPVLNNNNKLLGVITSQSIVSLVDDEMGEDYAMFKGKTFLFAYAVSGCIGLSLVLAMVVSGAVGTCIPLFFKKIHVDPAVASGPLITTINDLVAVVSYYGLSWILLINILHLAG